MSPHLTFDWQLPEGFVAFSPDDCTDAWLERFVASRRIPDAQAARTLEARVRRAVVRCHAEVDRPDGWALVLLDRGGVCEMAGVADVTVTPWIDPGERLRAWRADLGRRGASPGECRLVESRDSTAALLRTVDLVDDGERDTYVERGIVVKSWPRLGVTGVLRVTAATLLVFDDLMGFLEDTTAQFTLGPRRSGGLHRLRGRAAG